MRAHHITTEHMAGYRALPSTHDSRREPISRPSFGELIPGFLDHLQFELVHSKETVGKYRICLKRIDRELPEVNGPVDLEPEHVTSLKKRLVEQGVGPAGINSIVFALRKLLSYCRGSLGLQTLRPQEVRPMRIPRREVSYLTEEEVHRLLESIPTRDKRGLRIRALMELLLATGMRISEALSLDREDVRWEAREATIIGKGNKQRVVYLTERSITWMREYLASRGDDEAALFVTFGVARRLKRYDLGDLFDHYAQRAGIKKRVTPHLLRHTMATLLLKNGCDIRHIQQLLGHSEIQTTAQYYLGTDRQALKAAHAKFLRF